MIFCEIARMQRISFFELIKRRLDYGFSGHITILTNNFHNLILNCKEDYFFMFAGINFEPLTIINKYVYRHSYT